MPACGCHGGGSRPGRAAGAGGRRGRRAHRPRPARGRGRPGRRLVPSLGGRSRRGRPPWRVRSSKRPWKRRVARCPSGSSSWVSGQSQDALAFDTCPGTASSHSDPTSRRERLRRKAPATSVRTGSAARKRLRRGKSLPVKGARASRTCGTSTTSPSPPREAGAGGSRSPSPALPAPAARNGVAPARPPPRLPPPDAPSRRFTCDRRSLPPGPLSNPGEIYSASETRPPASTSSVYPVDGSASSSTHGDGGIVGQR